MAKLRIESGPDFSGLHDLLNGYASVFIVYDANVKAFASQISGGTIPMFAIKATENDKTIEQVTEICRWLLDNNADRDALVLAIGGGITTDMAGFAASIYKRGIRYANVPTTLLAQADAGIGGKTGVNLDSLKNMLGVISQPQFTYICPLPLETLPQEEMLSGLAEILKSFIIGSAPLYRKAVRTITKGEANVQALCDMAHKAAGIKARIVEKDEKENGLRRVLNLGHTFGHAIEWYQHKQEIQKPYSHGQAVAIGMIMAARRSEKMGIAQPGLAESLAGDFAACGLPTTPPCSLKELETAISKDKKVKDGKVHYVLIQEIGKITIE